VPKQFLLNHDIYNKLSIEKAIQDYSVYCNVVTKTIDKQNVEIEIIVNPKHEQNTEEITKEFLNYVLDLSIKGRFQ